MYLKKNVFIINTKPILDSSVSHIKKLFLL